MKQLQTWVVTFKPANKWTRYSNRFYVIKASSEDQARKKTLDAFGRDWENLYTKEEWENDAVMKRLPKEKYVELPHEEHARELERETRIRYKTFREKEN